MRHMSALLVYLCLLRVVTLITTFNLQGVLFIVPTFEAASARVRAYAVFECHKGLYYHHVD